MALALMDIRQCCRIWFRLIRFYFTYVRQFGKIHPDLPSGKLFGDTAAMKPPIEISLNVGFADEFNGACNQLELELTEELGEQHFETIMQRSFLARAGQCLVVWLFGWQLGLLSGLLQFVVAPLSLTSSFFRLFTNLSDCLIHYALNIIAVVLCMWCTALPKMTLDWHFVAMFFGTDTLLNFFVYFHTAEPLPWRTLLTHITYGSFNTKTYFIVVLGCLYGAEIDLLVVAVTSFLTWCVNNTSLQNRLLNAVGWPCFQVTFYVEHRLGHMPGVYQHAHKMHHYLHDTTAFDAHIYGSGMNEEFFWILAETLPCLLCPMLFPYFLNFTTLKSSWENKGGHSRHSEDITDDVLGAYDTDNYHADHHTYHRGNFGITSGLLMEFYFGTQSPETHGAMGRTYACISDNDGGQTIIQISEAQKDSSGEVQKDVAVENQEPLQWKGSITRQQLEGAASEGAMWVALHGGVFDLTFFQNDHPGGPQILKTFRGKDASRMFDQIGHSLTAKDMAKDYLIGSLEGTSATNFVADCVEKMGSSSVGKTCSLTTPLLTS